jgi:hypothetical protein
LAVEITFCHLCALLKQQDTGKTFDLLLDCERSLLSTGLASQAYERKGLPTTHQSRNEIRHALFALVKLVPSLHEHYLFKDYSTLGVHYRDLQARVHEQETRNLTLHEAQPSAVLNFEFLVRERVLVNPDSARTKSALNVLIFSLSKP